MFPKFAIAALFIFLIFRILHIVNKAYKYDKKIKYHINYILPIIEFLIWIKLALQFAIYIYEENNFTALILFVIFILILAIPGFFLIRDFSFGVYLKILNKIDKGDFIEFDNIKGEILRTRNFNIELRDKQGHIKTIPYSKIKSKIIDKHGTNPNLKKQILTFNFPENIQINKIVAELEKNLLNTPWVSISQAPFIESITTENGKQIIQMAVFTLKKEYIENIRQIVEKNLSYLN
ncbi:MAG: mechanosensitive ion channel [Bacteroidales bacterium]|nr:mechanosensitive ion channel [Bacteroidales bacterium]